MHRITLEYLLECIDLDKIRVHSLFDFKLLYSNNIPFCMLYDGQLYIRASSENKKAFAQMGYQPLIRERSFYRVTTQYYPFPDEINNDREKIRQFVSNAYLLCQSNTSANRTMSLRIRDLPNLQLRHERLLKKVGISTVDELKKIGADKAFKLLKKKNNDISIEMLYKLQGAILGKHAHLIKVESEQKSNAE